MQLFKPRILDLLSFEAFFVLFIFSGYYKDAPSILWINDYVDITLGTAILSLVFGLFAVIRRGIGAAKFRWVYMGVYILFLGCVLMSSFFGYSGSNVHYLYAVRKLQAILTFNSVAFVLPLLVVTTREQVERYLRLILWFAIFACGYAATVTVTNYGGLMGTLFGGGSSHSLAYVACFGLTISLASVLFSHNMIERFVLFGTSGLMVFAILLSTARQAMAGMFAACLCLFYMLFKSGMSKWQLFWLLIAPPIMIYSFYAIRTHFSSTVDIRAAETKMIDVFTKGELYTLESTHRLRLWVNGIDVWKTSPIIGVGLGCYDHDGEFAMRYPHNYFVELLAEMGLLGFITGAALIAVPFWLAIKYPANKDDWIWPAVAALWVLYFAFMMFSGDIMTHRTGFAFAAMVVSYWTIMRSNKDDRNKRVKHAFVQN